MTAAGQVTVELILITAVFLLLVGVIVKDIPLTFSKASPYLAGKVSQRLETGGGFSRGGWGGRRPTKSYGGMQNEFKE